jgi:hypothetical protein
MLFRSAESSGFVLMSRYVVIAQRLADFGEFVRANAGNHGIVTGAGAAPRLAIS